MAEEVRGGLQLLGRGQYEGAMALGLTYSRMMALVILPQALTMVIPGIVNNFVGLFMDTTLVSIVGVTDFLEAMNNAFKDPAWSGPTIMATGYAFAANVLLRLLLRDGALFAPMSSAGSPKGRKRDSITRHETDGASGRVHQRSQMVRRLSRPAQYQSHGAARRAHRRLRPLRIGQVDAHSLRQSA